MEEVFPKIWGLSLVFGAFLKIQYAFDEKSVGVNRWWIMLIFAAVSLAIGVLALLEDQVFGDNQHLIIGIFMLGEAVLDLVTYLLLSRGMKKQNSNLTGKLEPPVKPEALERTGRSRTARTGAGRPEPPEAQGITDEVRRPAAMGG